MNIYTTLLLVILAWTGAYKAIEMGYPFLGLWAFACIHLILSLGWEK